MFLSGDKADIFQLDSNQYERLSPYNRARFIQYNTLFALRRPRYFGDFGDLSPKSSIGIADGMFIESTCFVGDSLHHLTA